MCEAAPRSLQSLPVIPVGSFFDGCESDSRRQSVLYANRALGRVIPPAVGLTHEVSELAVDSLFAQRQFEILLGCA